jgi:single-stranded DNA-specific DHH superfamily exonuclease
VKKLEKSLSELYNKAESFLKKIKPIDEVVIVYHKDVDGLCSAVLLSKLIQKITRKEPVIIPRKGAGVTIDENTKREILSFEPSVIITLDLQVDTDYKKVIELQKISKAKLMIIDHHPIVHHFKKPILQINPRLYFKDIYLPTSYLIYKIAELFIPTKNLAWIAALGVIGDRGEKNCKELLEKINKKTKRILYKADLLLSSARSVEKEKSYEFVKNLLKNSKDPKEIVKNKKLIKLKEIVDKEIKKLIEEFKRKKEKINKDVFFFCFRSKFDVGSALSKYLLDSYPSKTIILAQKKSKEMKIYAKSYKIDVAKLLKKTLEGIGIAGGHPVAAGGDADIKNFEKFKRNLKIFFKQKSKI